jgi:NAD(P)-dependent dehydrogenase (short-subunit alcohol dehydrogenase family)
VATDHQALVQHWGRDIVMEGNRLEGRKILITGAASGIGSAVASLFHAHGAKVALLDRDKLRLSAEAQKLPGAVEIVCDVTDEQAVLDGVNRSALDLGGLDGVVNVAGIDLVRSLETTTVDAWRHVLDVNLTGPMLVCRAAVPHLRKHANSSIVNVGSAASVRPIANRAGYCVSKAGLLMLSRVMALEFAKQIRVNTVCPGTVDTPMVEEEFRNSANPDADRMADRKLRAMERFGEPLEIAYAILHLVGDESSFTTGSTLVADGGRAFH